MKKNKKYKIGICGGFDNSIINGQALRTISITNKIVELAGADNVFIVKYANWKKRPLSLLFEYIKQIKQCKSVVLCPDERAIRFLIPIANFFSSLFKTRVYYVVIGGWLPSFLKKHHFIFKQILSLNGLFVQTKILQSELKTIGISKVYILPNFRNIDKTKMKFSKQVDNCPPLKAFFLSRVEDSKGVEEMINVFESINREGCICSLDIFGSIMPSYRDKFVSLMEAHHEFIRYCGELQPDRINGTIYKYDLHIFPTKYKTEGFPGSILDSFYAGVPTLSANWNSGKEIINDYDDGVLFVQYDFEDLKRKLIELCHNKNLINKLKKGARLRGIEYDGDIIIKEMLSIVCEDLK